MRAGKIVFRVFLQSEYRFQAVRADFPRTLARRRVHFHGATKPENLEIRPFRFLRHANRVCKRYMGFAIGLINDFYDGDSYDSSVIL